MSLGGDTVIAAAAAQATAAAVQPFPRQQQLSRPRKRQHYLPHEQQIDLPGSMSPALTV